MAAGGSSVLAEVALGGAGAPSGASAWCRVSNLLALALAPATPSEAAVLLMEPSCPGEAVRLRVPLIPDPAAAAGGGGPRGVAQLEWSPPGSPRMLLLLTHCGRIFGYRQPKPTPSAFQSINEWQGRAIMSLLPGEKLRSVHWLEPQSNWSWPASRASGAAESMESSFVAPKEADVKNSDHVLHWVRPGLLAFAAVLANGHIRVWSASTPGADHWAERKTSIAGLGDGQLAAADVTVGPSQTLRLGVVRGGDGGAVTVFEMRGDPTAESAGKAATKLTVAKVAHVPMAGQSMGTVPLGLHFEPTRAGRRFCCLLDDKVGGALQVASYRQKGKSHFELAASLRIPLGAAPGAGAPPRLACLRWSPDGQQMALVLAERPSQLMLLNAHGLQRVCDTVDLAEGAAEPWATAALAFSPNGTCLAITGTATVHGCASAGSASRLKLLCAPDTSGMQAAPGRSLEDEGYWKQLRAEQLSVTVQADRMLWCMLHDHHHWDVVARLQALRGVRLEGGKGSSAAAASQSGMQLALQLADDALHAHPRSTRTVYGAGMDLLKAAALAEEEHPDARAVLMDLRTRNYLAVVENMFKSFFHQEDFYVLLHRQKQQSKPAAHHLGHAEREALLRWTDWMVEYCAFFMSAMVTWVARHRALAAAGPGKLPPPGLPASAIPCVRLLPDQAFLKRLTGTVIFCLFCVQTPDQQLQGKRDKLNRVVEFLKRAGVAIQSNCQVPRVEDPEKAGAEVAAGRSAAACFQAQFSLHYSRTGGAISWQVIADVISQCQTTASVEPLSDEAMYDTARRLGLLPGPKPRPAPPAGALFLAATGGGPLHGVTHARRKRWRSQRDAAFGIAREADAGAPPTTATAPACERDIVSGAPLAGRAEGMLEDTSGGFLTAGQPSAEVPGGHVGCMLSAGSAVCGVTGARWKRIAWPP
eukprot:jgi/Tetstr1/459280/TSEL_004679.t1